MRFGFSILIFFMLSVSCVFTQEVKPTVHPNGEVEAIQHFPGREDLGVLCWTVFDKDLPGYLSQIVILMYQKGMTPQVLWQSSLDQTYDPEIRFLPEIKSEGLPLVLVKEQIGAAYASMNVIAKVEGHFTQVSLIGGVEFEILPLEQDKPPFIIAHHKSTYFDVPDIYRWNGSRFALDNRAHPGFYRSLFEEDKNTQPIELSLQLQNLARIADLAGELGEARMLLLKALVMEEKKGDDQSMQRSLRSDLQKLEGETSRQSNGPGSETLKQH
jgi:hypothetical protein